MRPSPFQGRRNPVGSTQGAASQLIVPFQANAAGVITLTNQPNSEQFLANSNRNVTLVDLSQYTQARLVCRVVTASVSANSPRIYARYQTSFSTTVGSYLTLGTSEIQCALSPAGVAQSGWVNLAAGARADVLLTVLQNGGDGAADPALAMIAVQFR